MADKVAKRTSGELSETAQRYDRLRKNIPLIQKPNALVLTSGILGAFPKEVAVILWMVRKFDTFNEDNDPWHEHDFGAFEYKGENIFWKIDDHGGYEGYELVLTVMLASEY
ncbi:MAG: hypothetical protein A4E57_00824 [Syntrophorhabdaceae bacterium PtaU1.Bin034]|jgi:hypothetical protein|nr:MAG: hypothetical protein A4E57_00824 [Syntrophorhabdaceae bacterium PtaU1.Bin034]